MRARIISWLCAGISVALAAGCGSSKDDNPLGRWAGVYLLAETFFSQEGTGCAGDPAGYEGAVEVEIDGNKLNASFERWSELKGEVRENGSVIASGSLGAGESVNLSGSFAGEGGQEGQASFDGNLRHTRSGCTRIYTVQGPRQTPVGD
ncbi:MAG: hypothetical protein JXR96_28345 [Deltaproteobacteria bacterium]|nr:hypothetical protein [Deltaproteobacteria bacterium]